MKRLPKTMVRGLAIVLTLCVFQLYVGARGTSVMGSTSLTPTLSNVENLVLGRLTIDDDQYVVVNGNNTNAGATILSGSRIQTFEGVEATIQVGAASVYLEPGTDATLNFDKSNINIKVANGDAVVTAPADVMYSITTPDGKTVTASGGGEPEPYKPWHKWSKKEKAALIIPLVFAAVFIPLCVAKCGGDESSVR